MHRHRLRRLLLRRGDEVQFAHALQHVIATDARTLRVGDRVAAGRELGDRGQGCDLVQVELVQGLAVVELGGRGDSVGAVAEEALVEIELEDLVLAEFALHLHGQQHFGQLAGIAVFGAEEELPGDLLGDGGATGHSLVVRSGQQPDRPGHAAVVDAVVLVEAVVLDGDEGLLDPFRDPGDFHRVAPGLAEYGHQAAVPAMDVQGLLELDGAQRLDVGQLRGDHEIARAGGQQAQQ